MTYPNKALEHKVLTRSGRLLDLAYPDPSDILIDDIAHGLSRQFRYGGAFRDYSVAQHCVAVAKCVYDNWPGEPHHGLLDALKLAMAHDAAEAYIRDMPTPAKKMLPDYVDLEHRVLEAVFIALNISAAQNWSEMVKDADSSACGAEARVFAPGRLDIDELFPAETLPVDRRMLEEDWTPNRSRMVFLRIWGILSRDELPQAEDWIR